MPDNNGNLLMVFDTMSNTLDPSIQYTARHTTDAHGTFENNIFLIKATKPLNISFYGGAYGDFGATSFDGNTTNNIWMASEYAGANGDWSTYIGETHF